MSQPTARERALNDVVRLLTDLRTLMAFCVFALTWHLFDMIGVRPELTSNQGFMFLAQALIVTGFVGGVLAFLFIASKSASDARQQQAQGPAQGPATPPATAAAPTEPAA
jgi:hypothetical protein